MNDVYTNFIYYNTETTVGCADFGKPMKLYQSLNDLIQGEHKSPRTEFMDKQVERINLRFK